MITSCKEVQSLNDAAPIVFTLDGTDTFAIEAHSLKALVPILVNPSFKVTVVK